MRVISALVLTHCFGCVIPDDSDEDITLNKSVSLISKKNASNLNEIISPYESEHTKASFSNVNMRKLMRNRANCRGQKTENYDWVHSKVYVKKLIPPKSSCPYSGYRAKSRKFRGRRLLNYSKESAEYRRSSENARSHKRTRNAQKRSKIAGRHKTTTFRDENDCAEEADDDDSTESEPDLWDNWSNWSSCSTTCGRGRQVRWRHCSTGKCYKGLKKAQIKSCHQKECDKGILSWLGIKS